MEKSNPSDTFSKWVEEIINNPTEGDCLPPVRELSRRFGISLSSVQSRLKPYIADGRLTAIRGRGTYITSRMPQPSQPGILRSTTSASSIADALAEDIAVGKLKHGEALPSVKLLCAQFKTGHATITQAYRLLQQKGLARRVGKRYWVGGLQSIRSFGVRKAVICFNFSEGDATDLTSGSDFLKAFEVMENELHNHNLNIRFEDCENLDFFLRPGAFQKTDYSGVIITSAQFDILQALFSRIQSLETILSRSGKKILICGLHPERRIPKHTNFFCHGTIITNVVRTAAEYCFRKGFQKAVLLFRETENNTSDIRFFLRFISELLVRNPGADIRFLIQPLYHDTSPEQVFQRTPTYTLFKHFEYLEGLLSKYRPFTMNELYKTVTMGDTLNDLLTHIPRGAVWIMRDASTACSAADWCKTHRKVIPSEAALLCFDGDPCLHYRGIASCVPDWHTIGYVMAHALLGDIPLKKSRKGFLRTPAVLYERSTMP